MKTRSRCGSCSASMAWWSVRSRPTTRTTPCGSVWALDLYTDALIPANPLDIRGLSWAPTADAAGMQLQTLYRTEQPVATVSGVFSAASPSVKRRISAYAVDRGTSGNARHNERMMTIDMNLYSEFVGHEMGSRLMWAEWQRLARQRAQEVSRQADAQTPESP
ncbi:hypothetical protein OT109_15895 [Phycisphaeraceae bacterium D3-23]